MYKLFKVLFNSSKLSFLFISFIIFTSLFSFILTWNIISSVEKYINETAKDFLWADIIISDRTNFLEEKTKYLNQKYNIELSKRITFETSIFDNNKPDLYTINFIEPNYPFYWNFKQKIINEKWNLIVSRKVYDKFKSKPIEILWNKYIIKSYLEEDFLWDFNPFWWNDIYIDINNYNDSILSWISRVNYNLLIKTKDIEKIKNDIELKKYTINTEETSNNTLNWIISRLNIFIQVFYQIIIILAFFIVSISMNSYFKKITKDLKVLNILWLENYKIISGIFILFLMIAIFSTSISYISVYVIFESFKDSLSILETNINLLYKWIFLSFLIILSWSFLNLINLKITWINNFNKENILQKYKKYIVLYFLFLLIILFFVSYFSWVSIFYSIIISISFITFLATIIVFLNYILRIIFKLISTKLKKNFYVFDAIRSTIKPWNLSNIIIISSFISVSWFLIFSTFSNWFIDFLDKQSRWKIDTFVINLDEKDINIIKEYFTEDNYYEILRSRIISINWKTLKEHLNVNELSPRFTREFNSTTKQLSELIKKWKELSIWEVWVDEEFAKDLNINIWDTIKFIILWIEKDLKITQIRKAERDWLSPFFYFNFYDWDFNWFSKNYFLSYNSKEKYEWFNLELSKKLWDQVSFIDIWNIIEKIKEISKFILYFVYIILIYIAFFSIITFITSVNFLKSFKKSKIEIYNKFWWLKSQLQNGIFYEYSYLIIIWILLSVFFSITLSFWMFYNNEFLTFNFIYFIKSFNYVIIFIFLYLTSYYFYNKYTRN